MIIRIEASGGSFRGAGQYYLHDKSADASIARELKPKTDERVWFTDTRNLMSTDPERALDEMWRTADDQAYLKMQAGVARGGRVCTDPVKTISLSWHNEDAPTPEHMIASADSFLKHMGWDGHQVVYVGHNDTAHRHVHIILNRVHPETGRTLDDFRERKRAQSWALAYEKEHQNVRCEQRELNAARRDGRAPDLEGPARDGAPRPTDAAVHERAPANDHLPHNVIAIARPFEKEFQAHEQARREADHGSDRDVLKVEQREARKAFFEQGGKLFKATRHAVYDEVRKEYREEWRQFYKDKGAAEREAETWSKTAVTRALYFAERGEWGAARTAFADRDSVRDAVAKEIAARKADLVQRQTKDLRERQRDAGNALRDIRDAQYQELLQHQREERTALKAGHTLADIRLGQQQAPSAGPQAREAANDDRSPAMLTASAIEHSVAADAVPDRITERSGVAQAQEVAVEPTPIASPAAPQPMLLPPGLPEAPEPTRQIADLAAGAIGSAAAWLADQLGELLAPTPPEVRKAEAREQAAREASRPAAEPKSADPDAELIEAALRLLDEERRQQDNGYWKDRDKGKGWERDR